MPRICVVTAHLFKTWSRNVQGHTRLSRRFHFFTHIRGFGQKTRVSLSEGISVTRKNCLDRTYAPVQGTQLDNGYGQWLA